MALTFEEARWLRRQMDLAQSMAVAWGTWARNDADRYERVVEELNALLTEPVPYE